MISLNFIIEHWIDVIFGLVSSGAIAYCRMFYKKVKEFEKIEEEKDREQIELMVDNKIKPLQKKYHETTNKFIAIRDFYKHRLIELCKIYLERGHITTQEYDQLSELWKMYHNLGGNGQAEDYYLKIQDLPNEKSKRGVD